MGGLQPFSGTDMRADGICVLGGIYQQCLRVNYAKH